jgi:ubiquitin
MIPITGERFQEEKEQLHKIIDKLAEEIHTLQTTNKELQFIIDALDERVTDLEDKLEL